MTRRATIYRLRQAQQADERHADESVDASERAALLAAVAEDAGDRACDDALIASAKAFCVAMINQPGRKSYLWRAARPIPCQDLLCDQTIEPDGYFTSISAQLEKALEEARCLKCRRFTWPKGVKR